MKQPHQRLYGKGLNLYRASLARRNHFVWVGTRIVTRGAARALKQSRMLVVLYTRLSFKARQDALKSSQRIYPKQQGTSYMTDCKCRLGRGKKEETG